MFLKSADETQCGVYCACGCCNGVVLRAEHDKSFGCEISLVSDIYFRDGAQTHRWIEKLKRIWRVICNKEHCYFELYIDRDDLLEFKSFVAQLPVNSDTMPPTQKRMCESQ